MISAVFRASTQPAALLADLDPRASATDYLLFFRLSSFYCASGLIHDLRHSHASLLIEKGFSAVAIAERLGHESSNVTFHYAHHFPDKQGEMARSRCDQGGHLMSCPNDRRRRSATVAFRMMLEQKLWLDWVAAEGGMSKRTSSWRGCTTRQSPWRRTSGCTAPCARTCWSCLGSCRGYRPTAPSTSGFTTRWSA
ncbi:MAG: tyrosine-type recombinase/integrase [Atopobium sp.]|nr:tyrosine-type recombinase/integrase [Atopobium sp.]